MLGLLSRQGQLLSFTESLPNISTDVFEIRNVYNRIKNKVIKQPPKELAVTTIMVRVGGWLSGFLAGWVAWTASNNRANLSSNWY